MDEKTRELIAIGCSVTANCHPCIRYHVNRGREMGIDPATIDQALRVGVMVRKGAAGEMDKLIQSLTGTQTDDVSGCSIP